MVSGMAKIKMKISPSLTQKSYINSIDTLNYNYFTPELNLEFDTRDIYWNSKRGVRIIQTIEINDGGNSFYIWNQSLSIYIPSYFNITLALNTTIQKKYGYKMMFGLTILVIHLISEGGNFQKKISFK